MNRQLAVIGVTLLLSFTAAGEFEGGHLSRGAVSCQSKAVYTKNLEDPICKIDGTFHFDADNTEKCKAGVLKTCRELCEGENGVPGTIESHVKCGCRCGEVTYQKLAQPSGGK